MNEIERTVRPLPRLAWGFLFLLTAGCLSPREPAIPPDEARLFAAPEMPADFDPQRAQMSLAEVPDDPPAPVRTSDVAPVELPRQAMRRMEEARRLFSEQRYTEAMAELTTALRYHADIVEAHRLMALAAQLSGDDEKASQHAIRALELQGDDLVCHYILGALAEKKADHTEAMKRYRMALKCPSPAPETGYPLLVRYQLGFMLEQSGYYAAAVEQLATFEQGIESLGEQARENPALAMIVDVKRGDAVLKLARAYRILGRHNEAADTLSVATRLSPKDWSIRGEQVRLLVSAGRQKEAEEAARAFVADSRGMAEALRLLLAVHRYAGRPEGAATTIASIIAEQPDNTTLKLARVDALLAANDPDAAATALAQLQAEQPDLAEVQQRLVALHRAHGNWPAWLAALVGELARRPDQAETVEAELATAPEKVANTIIEEALSPPSEPQYLQNDITTNAGQMAAACYLAGRLAVRAGRGDDARKLFERSINAQAGFLPATLAMAETYIQECRWQETLDQLDTVSKNLTQPVAAIEALRGRCHDGLDHVEEATGYYQSAVKLDPRNSRTQMWLARLYERLGRSDDALRQYETLLAVAPDHAAARERLIRLLWNSRDQMMRVVEELGALQRIAPGSPQAMRCIAMVKFLRPAERDWDKYIAALHDLLKAHPGDVDTREDLARAWLAQRKYVEAREAIEPAIQNHPCLPEPNELMSLVLLRQLELDQAAGQLRKMLNWYPNRESWLRELARLELLNREYAPAISLLERLLEITSAESNRTYYQALLMEALRRSKQYERAVAQAAGWLKEIPAEDTRLMRYRWFLLAACADGELNEDYLSHVRQWRKDAPEDVQLREWLIGVDLQGADGQNLPSGSAGLVGMGRYTEALLQLQNWLADEPDTPGLIEAIIHTLQAAGRHDEAIELAVNQVAASSVTDERVEQLKLLRGVYLRASRFDEAIVTARDMIAELRKLAVEAEEGLRSQIEADLFDQRRHHSGILAQAGQYDEAVAELEQMIEQIAAWRQRIAALFNQVQDPAQKEQLMHGELLARTQQMILLRQLCSLYQQRGDIEMTVKTGQQAYELAPHNIGSNNDFGYSLADLGRDLDQAERMIRLAVSEDPFEAAYLDSLGWVLYKRGQFQEARTWLNRAAGMEKGQDPVIFDHLGDISWRLGDKDIAITHWKRAIEVQRKKVAAGQGERDEKFEQKVQAKLEAAGRGEKPAVAEIPADTQPAR